VIYLIKEIKRRDRETFESLVRRFNRTVQENKTLSLAKKKQFFEKPLTKRELKEAAIRRRINRELKRKRQMGLIK
jgi:small subunit ribosomal protein S21